MVAGLDSLEGALQLVTLWLWNGARRRATLSGALQHAHVLGARALVEHRDAVFYLVSGLQDAARHGA